MKVGTIVIFVSEMNLMSLYFCVGTDGISSLPIRTFLLILYSFRVTIIMYDNGKAVKNRDTYMEVIRIPYDTKTSVFFVFWKRR